MAIGLDPLGAELRATIYGTPGSQTVTFKHGPVVAQHQILEDAKFNCPRCIHWSARSRFNKTNRDAVFVPGVSDAMLSARKFEEGKDRSASSARSQPSAPADCLDL